MLPLLKCMHQKDYRWREEEYKTRIEGKKESEILEFVEIGSDAELDVV